MGSQETEALQSALLDRKNEAGRRPGAKRRKVKRKRRATRGAPKDKSFRNFLKAAKYVRGAGAGQLHPSVKVRLFGLQMQAKHGDAPPEDLDSAKAGERAEDTDSLLRGQEAPLTLERLKLKAWRSESGKDRKTAMKEHVSLLTSVAPQWRVSNLLGRREDENLKPRQMVWVLRVECQPLVDEDEIEKAANARALSGRARSRNGSERRASRSFCATFFEVMQTSGDLDGKRWTERRSTSVTRETTNKSDVDEQAGDPYVAALRVQCQGLALGDCIIDKSRHKSIEEQRIYFATSMREMASDGSQGHNNGWERFGQTSADAESGTKIDIYSRTVEWSPSKQLRSAAETELGVELLYGDIVNGFVMNTGERSVASAAKYSNSQQVRKALSGYHLPFIARGDSWCTALQYRVMQFPWPLR